MKKLLIILLALIAFASKASAEATNERPIGLEFDQLNSTVKRPRSPIYMNLSAIYDAIDNCIHVSGTCEAKVNLYLNGNLIDHSNEVNATFELPETTGIYTVEVIGSNWTAIGYLNL